MTHENHHDKFEQHEKHPHHDEKCHSHPDHHHRSHKQGIIYELVTEQVRGHSPLDFVARIFTGYFNHNTDIGSPYLKFHDFVDGATSTLLSELNMTNSYECFDLIQLIELDLNLAVFEILFE